MMQKIRRPIRPIHLVLAVRGLVWILFAVLASRPGLAEVERVRAVVQTSPGGPMAEAEVPVLRVDDVWQTIPAEDAALEDDDLVLGIVVEGRARAYPVRHLASAEVMNDRIGGVPVAVTWCPLSASGRIFDRRQDERTLTFDFVRGLKHDNLLISDRETRSVWSQLGGDAIGGSLAETRLDLVPSIQTTWAFWQRRHPHTEVAVLPGRDGFAFRYSASETLDFPAEGGAHDPSSLGLGLIVWGQPAFFSLGELAEVPQPFVVGSGSSAIHLRHDADGLTAWAENADGTLRTAVLAYQRSWQAFHPNSRVFDAALACD